MKVCVICKKDFEPVRGKHLRQKCCWDKECKREFKRQYMREYTKNNQELIRLRDRVRYKKNIEKMKVRKREYYYNNREKLLIKKREYSRRLEIKERAKEYRKKNRKKNKEYMKKWEEKNKEHLRNYRKEYEIKNKEVIKKKRKKYKEKHREEIRIQRHNSRTTKEYRKKNNKRCREKEKNDKQYNLRHRLRSNLYYTLNYYTKTGKIMSSKKYRINYELIIEKLKPFPKDISKYHIDHIRPLCSFDLTNPEEVRKAFLPSNLQWLTTQENLRKGGRIEKQAQIK